MGKGRKKGGKPSSEEKKPPSSSANLQESDFPSLGQQTPSRPRNTAERPRQPSVTEATSQTTQSPVATQYSISPRQQAPTVRQASEEQLVKGASALSINVEWNNKSGKGSYANPYRSLEEKKKLHTGTKGRRIKILANHFDMKVKCEYIYRYDVKFKLPWKRPVSKRDKPILYRAIEEMKKIHKGKQLPLITDCIVFDGRSTLLSSKKFSDFSTKVNVKEDLDNPKIVEVDISLSFIMAFTPLSAIEQFEIGHLGNQVQPLEAVQLLNIILTYAVSIDPTRFEVMGNKYFEPANKDKITQIDAGKYVWHGSFQSVRVGWKMRLNINMANKPAYMKENLLEFLANFLHSRGKQCPKMENFVYWMKNDRLALDFVGKEIKDLKARFLRPDGHKRDYRMNRLGKSPALQKFKLENGQETTVEKYFRDHYNYKLKYPDLPCINVGDPKRNIYLPMECMELKQQVCPQSKVLGEATSNMIKVTAVKPHERQQMIKQSLKERNEAFQNDKYAKSFGISVQDRFCEIDARVLDPPVLNYGKNGSIVAKPRDGKWKVGEQATFIDPRPLERWAIFDTVTMSRDEIENFINAICDVANKKGMTPSKPRVIQERDFRKVDTFFHNLLRDGPSIVIVIVKDQSVDLYKKYKLLGDTEVKIPTQFVQLKNARGRRKGELPSPATIHNILLKINSKLGGTNQKLAMPSRDEIYASMPNGKQFLFREPIMIVGADVTHPAPDQLGFKPSICAVVASTDPSISRYISEIRVQYRGKDEMQVTEQIMDMEGIFWKLLKRFEALTKGHQPNRIIFYRDGVSEGQFEMVLNKEISAMQRACVSLNPNYQPAITYFVAQKRHHTRLFPDKPQNGLRNGNVLPGTVVDTDIVHPTVSSFFLASHEGIQGTTKPTYYVKLYDDNNLSADSEQALTYYLCHLYSRCERSVSYPAPTYNAHLAAFRARDHHDALISKYRNDARNIPPEELAKLEQLELQNYFV